ncbi:hypothetical protein PIB30_068123 [Stylosanthes scabra]|uniref:Uncharacterized protein n=1 Tax=Stylosanthes scabra TaxID=79078 RepID=A0ABU6UQM8_9FABA|nr:hypothetical protein [Stylosanthes scabra]
MLSILQNPIPHPSPPHLLTFVTHRRSPRISLIRCVPGASRSLALLRRHPHLVAESSSFVSSHPSRSPTLALVRYSRLNAIVFAWSLQSWLAWHQKDHNLMLVNLML